VKIPINLYHIPFATGVPISHELPHAMEKYPEPNGDQVVSDPKVYQILWGDSQLNMRTGTTEIKYALDHNMGAILAEGNNFTKQIAAVFAAKRAGKDLGETVAKLDAALKLLREGGVDEYGPMKYALSLQMGTRQFYQRPPNTDVTDEQKTKIKQVLEQFKQMS
jgi:dihydrodipicolinate synthase/N-acetylneuraminate lyase